MSKSSAEIEAELAALMGSGYAEPAKVDEPRPEENATENVTLNSEEKQITDQLGNPPSPVIPLQPVDSEAPFGRFQNGKPRKRPARNAGQPFNQQTHPTDTGKPVLDQATVSGILIDGAMFLVIVDMVLPLAFSALNNRFSDEKISPDDLQLTSDQRKQMTPIIDQIMKNVSMTGNPVVLLCFLMMTAYGMNFMKAKIMAKK